jgi:hypothetical protein
MKQLLIMTILVHLLFVQLYAQEVDETKKLHLKKALLTKPVANNIYGIIVTIGTDIPGADMSKRFGLSYRLGLALQYKTDRNFVFGLKGELITGNNIQEDSLLSNAYTSQGGVITQLGEVLKVGIFERGYLVGFQAGKLFPLSAQNVNSGITTLFSAGFMQHKIKLFDRDNSFPQLRNGYDKGYDRLTNGLYIENFTGYLYHAKNKAINFYAGINMVMGFTKGRRDYLYDVARADDASRKDILMGIRLGWILPIYKKIVEDTYY